jgi:membrane protein implicated in regulation of membrane protease activity
MVWLITAMVLTIAVILFAAVYFAWQGFKQDSVNKHIWK